MGERPSKGHLRVEDRPGGIRVLTLDNPQKRNALDRELLTELGTALEPKATRQVRAFCLRGAGARAFCSGYDLTQLRRIGPGEPLPDQLLGEVLKRLEEHPAPSVALVRGAAFGGGCELAAACDFRVGSASAVFCMPPARLGVVYAPEGLQRLISLLGLSRAKWMVLAGRAVNARTALGWGLLDALHSAAGAERAARALCRELAQGSQGAIAGMKRAFNSLARPPLTASDRRAIEALRRQAFQSREFGEGLRRAISYRRTSPPS